MRVASFISICIPVNVSRGERIIVEIAFEGDEAASRNM